MLVLTRKVDESIMIGDDTEVTIVEIKGDSVKLGISAPKKITVHRKEIYLAIQHENIYASKTAVDRIARIGGMLKKKK